MAIALNQNFTPTVESQENDGLRKPKAVPILGSLPFIRKDPLNFFASTAAACGGATELSFGFEKVLMLTDPAYIRHVSVENAKNYRKSKFYGPLKPLLGEGILLAEGDEWLSQRQTAGKAFQGPELKRFVTTMGDAAAPMIARWHRKAARGEPVDVTSEMFRLTLDIVLRCLFSVEVNERYPDVYDALTEILRDTEKRIWAIASPPRWMPTPGNARYNAALRILDSFVLDIVEDRRASGQRPNDFLQILIDTYGDKSSDKFNPRLLRDQALSMVLAGHDTTANVLSWVLFELSKNPVIARQLIDEVDTVLEGRRPAFEDLSKLPFIKMVFDETARLYPPAWTLSRTAVGDDQVGNHQIKSGDNIMLCAYAVHRKPSLWRNPEGFDPYRFAEANKSHQQYAYFPFGLGARTCLGARFALMESIVIIAMIFQSFRLELVPGQVIRPEPMLTLRPNGPINMALSGA